MSEAITAADPRTNSARGAGGGLAAKVWSRIPVVVRAVLAGWGVCLLGLPNQVFMLINLKLQPAVPWFAPLVAGYLWLLWRYLQGWGWPRSNAEARRRNLGARPLSRCVWRWALLAGWLASLSLFALTFALSHLVDMGFGLPTSLGQMPLPTLLLLIGCASVHAGIVEEAAFRGYMHGLMSRRYGALVAIVFVSLLFGLAHLGDSQRHMTLARMALVVADGLVYGTLVHLTGSILPGLVLHACGDAISGGLLLLWLRLPVTTGETPQLGFAAAARNVLFWLNLLEALVLAAAAVWAFRRLARVATSARLAGDDAARELGGA